MPAFKKQQLDATQLYEKLRYKYLVSEKLLTSKHPQAIKLLESKGIKPGSIREHAKKLLTSGALAGTILLTSPTISSLPVMQNQLPNQEKVYSQTLKDSISAILPEKVGPLSKEQETKISYLLYQTYGIHAVAKLGSSKLNDSYGLIGAEQHLPRYPGDTIGQHDEYQNSGITPGLGGWGYFARSKENMNDDLYLKEKYYVAVQTLYLPDWTKRLKFLVGFYKYRKVVVVNPVNGKTIVCDVADAGPAKWTGKHFGGSPEVMAYLGLNVHMQKGPVVLFFVDDSENKVPLGPLEYNINNKIIANKNE